MNIMLTSVGRRAYLVKYFKQAIGEEGQVHVCNSDDLTVAFQSADKAVISPIIYDSSYIPFLLEYCKENRIDILLSLFDIDLPILAQNKDKFSKIGTKVIVSEPDFVEICNDKWKSYLFLKEKGFHVPKSYITLNGVLDAIDKEEIMYPIVVKPRFGCGSIAMFVAENEMELFCQYRKTIRDINRTYLKYESSSVKDKILFQEMLNGQEYGADVINDLHGNFQNAIVKKKIAMRAGETDIAEVVDNTKIYSELKKLGQITGHIANLDCDIFLVNEIPYILEMNARFGGGYPFSHAAGCNLPQAIVNWTKGIPVKNELLDAIVGIRGYKEIYLTRQSEN